MSRQNKKSTWSVEQRLEYIEFRLYWEGYVNRSDLVNHFGVSTPQASADLAQYQEQALGNAVYDKTRKAYVAGPHFKPAFFTPSADEYLAQLRLIQAGLLPKGEAWAVPSPSYAIVPILRRQLQAETLRRIQDAIRSKRSIHVRYQSMSSPEPSWRWLSPHALGFDGFRWHARAWCERRKRFLDFVLTRILEVGEFGVGGGRPEEDLGWQREVTLRFKPHPSLVDGQRKVVELDFGMKDGETAKTMRICMAYYFIRQLGLEERDSEANARRHSLVLANRSEVEAAMKDAGVCDVFS